MKIFLLGFMGSGKSYVGKQLAERIGLDFIDLDHWIEEQEGESIAHIFKTKGEIAFREKERDALHEMAAKENLLIACGGGTPCFFDNMEWMKKRGVVVFLQVDEGVLFSRLKNTDLEER